MSEDDEKDLALEKALDILITILIVLILGSATVWAWSYLVTLYGAAKCQH
jgi:hypothetical protein